MKAILITIALFAAAATLILGGIWVAVTMMTIAYQNTWGMSLASSITLMVAALGVLILCLILGGTVGAIASSRVK